MNGAREGTMGIREIWDDAVLAFRGLVRAPRFTLFAAGTLALGVGASTAVFSALEGVVLNPLPFPESDRLVTVWRPVARGQGLLTPRPEQVEAWAGLDDTFESLQAYSMGTSVLTGRGEPLRLDHFEAGEGLLSLLGAETVLGRRFTADEWAGGGRPILLSRGLWIRAFGGDPGVLGRALTLDGEPSTVVGVVSDLPDPTSGVDPVEIWSPLRPTADLRSVSVVGLLREGVSLAEAESRLDAFADARAGDGVGEPADWRARVHLLADFGRSGVAATLAMLMGAVVLLLVIACVNIANLLLHRTLQVRRETAVRLALGASRARLLRHSLMGSLMLGLVGAAGGTALAWVALRVVDGLRPAGLPALEGLRLEPGILLFALGTSLAAGLLFGTAPALQLLDGEGTAGLQRGGHGGAPDGRGRRSRWTLVASEVGLSFALVLGAFAVLGSLREMQSRDPGFRAEGLVSVRVSLPSWRYEDAPLRNEAFRRIQEDLARLPGVEEVRISRGLPPNLGVLVGRLQREGRPPEEESTFIRSTLVSGGIAEFLGQPLIAGRDLAEGDGEDVSRPVLIGRSLAERLFPDLAPAQAVGRRFRLDEEGEYHTVVGITEDVVIHLSSAGSSGELAYFPLKDASSSMVVGVRLSPGTADVDGARIRDVIRQVEADALVDIESVPRRMAETLGRERFAAALLSAFAAVALLLSGVGLYGVLSQTVGERTREIGIRMSLGADAARVRRMVLRDGAGATLAGLVGGVLLAILGLRLATSELGGLSGLDEPTPLAWTLAAGVLAGVALLAMWMPAHRATRIAPTEAIRAD